MSELTTGELFAGIGGFSVGFERAGMRTLWFCEQDPYCQRVLARHWPGVPCHPDVRALVGDADEQSARIAWAGKFGEGWGHNTSTAGQGNLPMSVPYVDVLCGGFPCQDISLAGKGAGIEGSRSGLWREFARLIGELRPRYVVVENVPALTSRGLDRVLADLAACGFDAEWDHLPASAFGAPHRRDRLWLVAYADGAGREQRRGAEPVRAQLAPPEQHDREGDYEYEVWRQEREELADPQSEQQRFLPTGDRGKRPEATLGDSSSGSGRQTWGVEPDVGRVAHGVAHRVDRLRALGNSLVPQIAEWIGGRILDWERAQGAA